MKKKGNKLAIRVVKARISDARLIIKIHNSAVRNRYFNSINQVQFNKHLVWFKKKLISKKTEIYLGKVNNIKFGYVRFEEIKKKVFEISLGNLPIYYNKGLGTILLKKSLIKFGKKYKAKKVISTVKKFNIRSQKVFLKNGFIKTKFNHKKHFTINKFNIRKENYFEHKFS